jgi:hypothetical protein
MKVLEKGHITDTALEQYSLEHLAEPDLGTVEEHLLICATCQDRLQEVDEFVRAFRAAHTRLSAEEGGGGVPNRNADPIKPTDFQRHAPTGGDTPVGWFQRPQLWAAGLAFAALGLVMVPAWRLSNAPAASEPATIALIAQRGAAGVVEAPAGRVRLQLDLKGINRAEGTAQVEIADERGKVLWQRQVPFADSTTVAPEPGFAAGQYWVRIRAVGADAPLLREYGLKLR